jgi:hypothetical protein
MPKPKPQFGNLQKYWASLFPSPYFLICEMGTLPTIIWLLYSSKVLETAFGIE